MRVTAGGVVVESARNIVDEWTTVPSMDVRGWQPYPPVRVHPLRPPGDFGSLVPSSGRPGGTRGAEHMGSALSSVKQQFGGGTFPSTIPLT